MVESIVFNMLIYLFIVGNTIVLAMDRYDLSDQEVSGLSLFNYIFTGIFFFEMVIKLCGLGFRNYLLDSFNVFDCFIVILSLVDLTLEIAVPDLNTQSLKMIRALRLLRTIKLARQWPAF